MKKLLIVFSVVLFSVYAERLKAANHWSQNDTIKSVNIWDGGIYIWVESAVVNPAACSPGSSYVISEDSPIYDQLYKAALTAMAAKLKVRIVVSDDPASCKFGRPKIVAMNVMPNT